MQKHFLLYMLSWQNGTRCKDGVRMLWCHSYLGWLVLRVPSLHALAENFENCSREPTKAISNSVIERFTVFGLREWLFGIWTNVKCCPCKLHLLSYVESSYIIYTYSSPSNTYSILLLKACTDPLSMFCFIPPDLDCCRLHILYVSCCLLITVHHLNTCSVELLGHACYE